MDGTAALARRCPPLVLLGLLALATGLTVGARWVALAGLTLCSAGVLVSLLPLARTAARKRPTGAAAWSVVASVVWLLAALVVDALVLGGHAPHEVGVTWASLAEPGHGRVLVAKLALFCLVMATAALHGSATAKGRPRLARTMAVTSLVASVGVVLIATLLPRV